jgi:signal transduction histidine kinase
MDSMSGTTYAGPIGKWRLGPAEHPARIATVHEVPTIAGVLLAAGAFAEAVTRAAVTSATVQFGLVLCLLALASTLPLSFGRPVGAALTASIACVLSLALFRTLTVAGFLAQLAVLYRLGRYGPSGSTGKVLAAGLAAPVIMLALIGGRPPTSEARILTILLASMGAATVFAGIAQRFRSEALMHSTARQVIADNLLDHTARGERARIARELHDVVAHHISMVAVQAETARLTTPGMPAAGALRLSAIGDTARSALTEMRRLLGVLREDAQMGAAERRPQPGLEQLNDLLDESRDAAGTGTRLILHGSPVTLDPGVELAAYRIAQEALTNARRHAPGAAVDVELHFTPDTLQLRIRDNGPGPPADTRVVGHGLTGMRERAAAVGGSLSTRAAAGGGFVVEAELPATAAYEAVG